MSSEGARAGLSEAFVRELLDQRQPGSPLPILHFLSPSESADEQWRALAYVVRHRANGFMVLLPPDAAVRQTLEEWVSEDLEPMVVLEPLDVPLETPRGRFLGRGSVLAVDLQWDALAFFKRPSALRGIQAASLLKIMVGQTPGRPVATQAWEATEAWIAAKEEDVLFQEYYSAESGGNAEGPDIEPVGKHGASEAEDTIAKLQARILELEARSAPATAVPPALPDARDIFAATGPTAQLDDAAWRQLQAIAGQPPPRLGQHERGARPKAKPATDPLRVQFDTQAEVMAGAEEEDTLALLAQVQDPMQKLLVLQMQQTAAVLQKLAGKTPADPIAAALGSGSDGGSSTSSGVRGCTARDAFLKQIEDLPAVSRATMKNAMIDMGVSENQVQASLMREFVERRIPLGNMKTLTFMAYFLAWGWEIAYNQKNEVMMGWMARGLMLTEQAALDNGRMTMAWLLCGLPEPNWAIIEQNKARRSLRPFSKLAQPQWLAANLAFMKDLDYMESRLKDNKLDKTPSREEADLEDKPKKQKGKGKGKTKNSNAPAEEKSESQRN